jgi:cytochrome c oxidase subunit 2
MAVALLILFLVVITVLFHFFSPWWFTPLAADWGSMDNTVVLTFWVTGIVFIAINGFLVWVVMRYRHRKGQKAHYEPESKKLEWWLTIVTSVGVIAMLAPGLWVWARIVEVPNDAAVVEVVGQQWSWSFRFPGQDGVLGQVDIALMDVDNPFGMKPDDPAGRDDILVHSPELHLPVDRSWKFVLRSKDVLHNFTVAQFRVKMDLVPGMAPYIWLTTTRTGRFDIMCEELCGVGHFAMRGAVVVDEAAAFDDWLDDWPTWQQVMGRAAPDVAAGQGAFAVCAACHGANGEGNPILNAPNLTGLPAWYLERQLLNFKHGLRGAGGDDTYGAQMAPMAATLPDAAAVRNVAAYIDALPDVDPASTVDGDAARGQKLFSTCSSCHGHNAQGIWSINAPGLRGTDDWYLVRQLENYRQGLRGAHPSDLYGKQMNLVSGMLRNEQAVRDVVAYINTLE